MLSRLTISSDRDGTATRRFRLGRALLLLAFSALVLPCFAIALQNGTDSPVVVQPGAPGQPSRKLPASTRASLVSHSAKEPPTLIIRPFSQAGNFVSLREFTNSAFNQHHGIQSEERFGPGVDADGDGFVNELTVADVTAVTLYQATLPVPGQVIPADPDFQRAVQMGEQLFSNIGCSQCHIPALPLDRKGWIYTEPNPYNPPGSLQIGDAPTVSVDLTSDDLPQPRLKAKDGVVWVPVFTDFKLHDITSGPQDPNREPLDMNEEAGTDMFFAGNGKFLTRKL